MTCNVLVEKIQHLSPASRPVEIARLSTLILNSVDDPQELENPELLQQVLEDVNLRLQAANDQHCAMTQELESLAQSDPKKFSPEQIWVLIRSIKVQSQILRLYIGDASYEID